MKCASVTAILVLAIAITAVPGAAISLRDGEFRIGLNPAIHVAESGLAFDVWTVGWTHEDGAPLLMFEFGLTFIDRMAVTLTSSLSGDEPFAIRGRFISVYASIGLEALPPPGTYDWFGELGLMITPIDGLHVTIGYGSSAWLNIGVGLTTTVHDILEFIHRYADRSLG